MSIGYNPFYKNTVRSAVSYYDSALQSNMLANKIISNRKFTFSINSQRISMVPRWQLVFLDS
jgi:hypothetical protein